MDFETYSQLSVVNTVAGISLSLLFVRRHGDNKDDQQVKINCWTSLYSGRVSGSIRVFSLRLEFELELFF